MKKVLAIILMALAVTAVFVSCDDPKHEHSYSTEWKYDDTNHWHECSCGEKTEIAEHTFVETLSEDGTKVIKTCSVCKYEAIKTVSTWDGETADTSWYEADKTKNEYTLTSASQLAGLASLVNGGTGESNLGNGVSFSDVTINLAVDIDLNNQNWTPIGLYHDVNDTDGFTERGFSGTFNGQGHTIKNLKISCDNGKSSYRALFGYVEGGTVKNFTLEGTVDACDSAGVVGALVGGTIENVINKVNVSVSKAAKSTQAKAAGIVARVKGDGESVIKNCINEGAITSTADGAEDTVGGIVAWQESDGLTITECTNSGKVTGGGNQEAGGIVGHTTTAKTTIKNCTNTGTVTVSEGRFAGGIVGCIWPGKGVTLEGNSFDNGTPNKEIGIDDRGGGTWH